MMLVFWAIAAVLISGVLVFLLWPLLRPDARALTNAGAEKRAIFRQQFDEIAQDKANGMLDEAQYQVAKAELERRLLEELGETETAASSLAPDRRLAGVLLVLLPVAAILLYRVLGNPLAMTPPAAPSTDQLMAEHMTTAESLEPLLESLRQKLEKVPDDGEGWALLARSYVELGRHAEAVKAYEKATQLVPDDAQLLADYADALAMAHGRSLAGKPEQLVQQALKLDPHNLKAVMLAATAAFDRQDYAQAIMYWTRLQQALPPGSELQPELAGWLAEARTLSGQAAPAAPSQAAPAQAMSSRAITGTVRLAPALAGKPDPAATLFVFARAVQGSPMPLAIVRGTAHDLPYRFRLDDSTALMPGRKLSDVGSVVVVARISGSGDAKPQPGDLQGMTGPIKLDGKPVEIEIKEVVQ